MSEFFVRPSTAVNPICYLEANGEVLECRHLSCVWCGELVHNDETMAAVNAHRECLRKRLA